MARAHDREKIAEILGPCKVSWWATETLHIQCDPEKLKECVKYFDDNGFARVKWHHPMLKDRVAVDITKMIVTGEKGIY